ncbi:MAG: hypothetical protein IJ300_06905 [Clostridia bacterium]|nr:hypothetical protein [Clostridia bacterium]
MTDNKLRQFIKDCYSDVTFMYKGKWGIIIPDCQGNYKVGWGEHHNLIYTDVDEFLNAPIFEGKSFLEIKDDLIDLYQI